MSVSELTSTSLELIMGEISFLFTGIVKFPQGDKYKGMTLSMSSMMDSVRSLQGGDMFASYEPPPEAFEMQEVAHEDIPLMPLVIKTLFVSNATGDNLNNVKKLLYKVSGDHTVHADL